MIVTAKNIFRLKFCALLLLVFAINAFSQSGGSYQITSSATNGGGGTSNGGNYTLDWTIGEPAADLLLHGGQYSLQSGFPPTTQTIAPTAADSSIGGTVAAANGAPMGGVIITLGGSRFARTITDSNGHFSFRNMETGGLYTLTPSLVNLSFSPALLSFSLLADKSDAIFTASAAPVTANPLDTELYFVRQQYLDFLGREPDESGLNYWTSQIENCSPRPQCVQSKRIGVSAAFFVENEYHSTGGFVYRLYKGALGRQVSYQEFSTDRAQVLGGSNLDQNKAAFADAFVQRPEFLQKYSGATSAENFVDALIQNMRQASGVDLSAKRSTLLARYNSSGSLNESRALAVMEAIEDASFKGAEYNKAFVLMQYFGYLRRDPDSGGYKFWLEVLNNRDANNYRGMVCSFITSAEYQQRFASTITHTNQECGQ